MPAPKAPLLPTAKPKHSALFDLFNSSSTGHQRAENKAGSPTGWRLSRTTKLTVQFCDGAPSGKQKDSNSGGSQVESSTILNNKYNPPPSTDSVSQRLFAGDVDLSSQNLSGPKGIFNGLVIYINGSTYPLISDHKLKHLLAQNGAKVSIHLSRKQVTHVIVGTPSNQKSSSGAGGGLAAGKTQKEISRVGGCGIKYVGVEWALESIKVGKRLPEAQFANMKLSLSGQKTVRGNYFQVKTRSDTKQKKEPANERWLI